MKPEQAGEFVEIIFEGYLTGLKDAGWKGNPRIVRLAYLTAAIFRNGYDAIDAILLYATNSPMRAREILGKHSTEELWQAWREVLHFCFFTLAKEAEKLLNDL